MWFWISKGCVDWVVFCLFVKFLKPSKIYIEHYALSCSNSIFLYFQYVKRHFRRQTLSTEKKVYEMIIIYWYGGLIVSVLVMIKVKWRGLIHFILVEFILHQKTKVSHKIFTQHFNTVQITSMLSTEYFWNHHQSLSLTVQKLLCLDCPISGKK